MATFLDFFTEEGDAGCDTGGCTILPSTSFLFRLGLDRGDTVMKCVGVGRLDSIESSNERPSDIISPLALLSVSGMLITLLVVESASSLTNLCGSDSAGSEVSIGSESGGGLGLGCGEVQLLLGSSASASGWSAAGLRRSPTELLLECVAVLHGVSFTSHDCSEAAARAARTLWYADRSDLLPWRSVM